MHPWQRSTAVALVRPPRQHIPCVPPTAFKLSAALIAANHDPATLDMVCLDSRLTAAARREGFTVIDS
jgi:hypothetical protein